MQCATRQSYGCADAVWGLHCEKWGVAAYKMEGKAMSNESRAAFEAWLKREYSPLQPDCTRLDKSGNYVLSWSQTNWEAWQASRKVALEDAAKALMGADLAGIKDDQFLLTYTAQMLSGMATFIKGLE